MYNSLAGRGQTLPGQRPVGGIRSHPDPHGARLVMKMDQWAADNPVLREILRRLVEKETLMTQLPLLLQNHEIIRDLAEYAEEVRL